MIEQWQVLAGHCPRCVVHRYVIETQGLLGTRLPGSLAWRQRGAWQQVQPLRLHGEFKLRCVHRLTVQEVLESLAALQVKSTALHQSHSGGELREVDSAGQQKPQHEPQIPQYAAWRDGQQRYATVVYTEILVKAAPHQRTLSLANSDHTQDRHVDYLLLGGNQPVAPQAEPPQTSQGASQNAESRLGPIDVKRPQGQH